MELKQIREVKEVLDEHKEEIAQQASKKTGIDIATISRVLPSVIAGVGVYLAQAHFHVSHISDIVRGFMIL
jgi:uncharacterized protein YerC